MVQTSIVQVSSRLRRNRTGYEAIRIVDSRQYYERKRAGGKRHNAVVICLARRRCNVIFAMLKNNEFFREIPARTVAA